MTISELLKENKIVPVVTFNDLNEAEKILKGLFCGGLSVAEICFRTECAEKAIRLAVNKFPEMLVGAGTVICKEQCERAIRAGARFIVSPGLSEEVALVCAHSDIPYLPGCITPTEIIKALSLGIKTVKFFPAESYGGIQTIKALSKAFPQITFVPTGGVNEKNLREYLSFPKIVACGGSWMVSGSVEEVCRKSQIAKALVIDES